MDHKDLALLAISKHKWKNAQLVELAKAALDGKDPRPFIEETWLKSLGLMDETKDGP